jgi:uncharacterized protein YpuA (DUF1002 family)
MNSEERKFEQAIQNLIALSEEISKTGDELQKLADLIEESEGELSEKQIDDIKEICKNANFQSTYFVNQITQFFKAISSYSGDYVN